MCQRSLTATTRSREHMKRNQHPSHAVQLPKMQQYIFELYATLVKTESTITVLQRRKVYTPTLIFIGNNHEQLKPVIRNMLRSQQGTQILCELWVEIWQVLRKALQTS
jgi:hypothetical protein